MKDEINGSLLTYLTVVSLRLVFEHLLYVLYLPAAKISANIRTVRRRDLSQGRRR